MGSSQNDPFMLSCVTCVRTDLDHFIVLVVKIILCYASFTCVMISWENYRSNFKSLFYPGFWLCFLSRFFSCLCFFTSWLAIIVIIKCQTTFRSHSFVMLRLSIYDLTVFFFFLLLLCHLWFSSFIYQPYIHIINIMHIPLIQWLLLIRTLYHRFIYVYKNRLYMPTPLILNPHIAASTEITHTPPHLR